MKRFLFAALLACGLASAAYGQSVQQSGNVTPNTAAVWNSTGVIKGGATAADSPLTNFGVTRNGSDGICVASDRQSAAARNTLCLQASTSAPAKIILQNYGTATAQDLQFVINGTAITLPTGGSGFVQYSGTLVSGHLPCFSGTSGVVIDCGYAITAGSANAIPYWASSSSLSSASAAASSVLVTSSGSVPSLSQTLPSAVQANITGVGTIASGTWNGSAVGTAYGGTGATTLAAHGALIGEGTSAVTSVTTSQIGYCLLSQGASSDPIWASCASGTGTAGGADTQIQFNNATNLAGNANLTWVSPALTIGQNATTTGQLKLANGGSVGVSVTVQNPSATSAYNFNLPMSAGTSGQPMISGGGGSTAMSFGTLQVVGGGTACSAASGACLDNITNFSSTGYINRTGSSTYAFSTLIPLSAGGTNANLTASNGGIFYSTATAGAILSGTATANQLLASGASGAPAWTTATYPATTTVNQLLYSSLANTITGLATANSSILLTDSGGIPSFSQTLPSAVQGNITTVGTISSGTWQGTNIALNKGGTNASLTASTGGIFYSTASAGAILSGTATANLPMLSGATAAPTWAAISYPTSANSGGIPYFSSATAIASSTALTANQIMVGGGAGTAPTTFACATTTTVVHGGTPPTCSQIVAADVTTNTLTNATLAQMATVTLKGNPTSGTTNATDFTINGLTARGAPDASNDQLLIWDSAAGTLKKVTPGQVASSATAGVSSIAGNTGAFTLANGIDNSTNQIQLTAARRTLPTIQQFTSGSGTYTTPANVLWIEVLVIGGGGGGGGGGDGAGGGNGSNGANSTFGSSLLTSNLVAAGTPSSQGSGGATTVSAPAIGTGWSGESGDTYQAISTLTFAAGGNGGGACVGGSGKGAINSAGLGAGTNTGAGGAGGGKSNSASTGVSGGGGGAGGCIRAIITSPSATYSYTVGAGGAGGTAGTNGYAGGAGAAGIIQVIEHYGT